MPRGGSECRHHLDIDLLSDGVSDRGVAAWIGSNSLHRVDVADSNVDGHGEVLFVFISQLPRNETSWDRVTNVRWSLRQAGSWECSQFSQVDSMCDVFFAVFS